jgi:hypothetical protein
MQGQLKAALEQIDTGRTEANRAHDKRVLRQLLLVHARVKLAMASCQRPPMRSSSGSKTRRAPPPPTP